MVGAQAIGACSWQRRLGITRALFVALLVVDVVLVGIPVVELVGSGFRGGLFSAGATGGREDVWVFSACCLAMVLVTVALWWAQAWLTSRTIAATVTSDMLLLVEGVLVEAGVPAAQRSRLDAGLRHELRRKLSLVEYRPMSRIFRKPSVAARGNMLVAYSVARAVVSTFGRREIPECADRLEKLPSEWLSEQAVWRAAPAEERERAEAVTLRLIPLAR